MNYKVSHKRGLQVSSDEEMRKGGRQDGIHAKIKKKMHVRVNLRNLRPRRINKETTKLATLRTGVRSFPKKGASVAGGGPAH